jgi:hypothetical protein
LTARVILLSRTTIGRNAPNKQAIIDTTIAPTNDAESAILMNLNPGNYTTILKGANNSSGVGVVEAYDLDLTVNAKLANISKRSAVQTGENVMIGGFIVLGPDSQKVIIRAIAPSLSVPGKLGDPLLSCTTLMASYLKLTTTGSTARTSKPSWTAPSRGRTIWSQPSCAR